jgi:NAD(P)-dependent dehydrogenase (short-subunit alcohol dehydrogenase family)
MTGTGSTTPAGAGEDLLRRHGGEAVLITGASSGIGRQLARQFAGDGAELVLIARSEDTLRELAGELTAEYGVTAQVLPADLTLPGSPDQIAQTLAQRQTDVDVLVNNAGFGARGPVAGIGVQRQLEMIEVNVAALTRLTALLLPGMLQRRRGGILNVASTAAFQPVRTRPCTTRRRRTCCRSPRPWPRKSAARECGCPGFVNLIWPHCSSARCPAWPRVRRTPGSRRRPARRAAGCSGGA